MKLKREGSTVVLESSTLIVSPTEGVTIRTPWGMLRMGPKGFEVVPKDGEPLHLESTR